MASYFDPDRYSLVEVMSRYTTLVPEGSRYFRDEEHSSLVVDSKINRFFWNAGGVDIGNVIDYLVVVRGMGYDLAIRSLKRVPTSLESVIQKSSMKKKSYVKLGYDLAISHHSRLYAGGYQWWLSRGVQKNTVDRLRLGTYQEGNTTWYTIPIPSYPGRDFLANYKLRRGDNGQPRYRQWVSGLNATVYVPFPELLEESDHVVVVGGEIKAIVLGQYGIPSISSSSGVATWDKNWTLVKDKKVVLCLDPKEHKPRYTSSGKEVVSNAKEIAAKILLSGAQEVHERPMDHDPDDEIVIHGTSPDVVRAHLLGRANVRTHRRIL
jgi:hypothetical protein